MSQPQDLRAFIRETAKSIREAHQQIPGPKFIDEYASLVDRLFPGGYSVTLENIRAGDAPAIEFGLVFVEARPYFFRSQYHRTKLIRMLKHAKLTALQSQRLKLVIQAEHKKKVKRKTNG